MVLKAAGRSRPGKYKELVEQIKGEIRSGKLRPGDRLPGFAEMQSSFGAASNTINRALIALEQDGLIIRSQGRGIFVAPPKRHARRNIIGCAGFAFQQTTEFPYWVHLLEGMQHAAAATGNGLLFLNDSSHEGWDKVDGVIGHAEIGVEVMAQLAPGIPTVSVQGMDANGAWVMADDRDGCRQATRHLLSLGHRRIGFILYIDEQSPVYQRRLAGYRSALEEAGIKPNSKWIRLLHPKYGDFPERGCGSMKDWLQDDWKKTGCTAVLVQNDRAAVGVIEALQAAGIDVPGQVSVIGFDGTEECEHVTPRLTSVGVPLEEIGARAVQLLLSRIDGDDTAPAHVMLATTLQLRESTGPPPAA